MEPFIIYLNSRFVGTVKSNLRKRRAKKGFLIVLMLIFIGAVCFGIGKLL